MSISALSSKASLPTRALSIHQAVAQQRALYSGSSTSKRHTSINAMNASVRSGKIVTRMSLPLHSSLHRVSSIIPPGNNSVLSATASAKHAHSIEEDGEDSPNTHNSDESMSPTVANVPQYRKLNTHTHGLIELVDEIKMLAHRLRGVPGALKLIERSSDVNDVVEQYDFILRHSSSEPSLSKALSALRRELRHTKTSLQQMEKIWFRRPSRLKGSISSLIEHVSNATTALRVAALAVQISSRDDINTQILFDVSSSDVPVDKESEALSLLGDKFYFGHGVTQNFTKAFKAYHQASLREYAPAMNSLATLYRNGHGTTLSIQNAIEWYTKSADRGSVDAVNNLAQLQFEIAPNADELSFAIDLFAVAASNQHVDAACTMGALHEHGSNFEVIERDIDVAEQWYRVAADAGYDKAQNNLGHLLLRRALNEPTNDDKSLHLQQVRFKEAIVLLRASADNGNATALNNLAICYEDGQGVKRDLCLSERLYEKAAILGSSSAMANFGYRLLLRKQYAKARQWLWRALDTDESQTAQGIAHMHLGTMFENALGVPRCLESAYSHFRAAAKTGHAGGMHRQANCLLHCYGVPRKNSAQAFQLCKKSAELDCEPAQILIATMLEDGIGVEQDFHHARYWLERVAAHGNNAKAFEHLSRFYENGQGVERDEHKSMQLLHQAAELGSIDAKLRVLAVREGAMRKCSTTLTKT